LLSAQRIEQLEIDGWNDTKSALCPQVNRELKEFEIMRYVQNRHESGSITCFQDNRIYAIPEHEA